jgi:hypothetical protein
MKVQVLLEAAERACPYASDDTRRRWHKAAQLRIEEINRES